MLEKLGRNLEAAEAFERALYTFSDLSQVGAVQFYYVTHAYEASREFCKAMRPLEQFVAFDPSSRLTPDISTSLAELQALGKCAVVRESRSVVSLNRSNNLLLVKADINGIPALLILDTGASAVHLTKRFAERAGIPLNEASMVQVQGVYGSGPAYFTSARNISVGSQKEFDVRVLVGSAGDGLSDVDGLLGQTFLSRFKVTIDDETMSLEPRTQ